MKRIIGLLSVLLASACLRAAAVPPPEKLLPNDTLALMTAPDYQKLLTICSNSSQLQLWNDPALQPFRKKLTDKITSSFLTPLEHDLGIHFKDYTSLPQGQVTFAVVQNGWDGRDGNTNEPGLVLLIDTKDKSSQLKTNLADLRKKWTDADKSLKTEKIRDTDFSVITLSSKDLPKTLKPASAGPDDAAGGGTKPPGASAAETDKTTLYIGQADSLLVIANSPKVVEKLLNALSGSGIATLGEVPAFVANQNSLFRDAPAYGWVNLQALVNVLKQAVPPPPPGDSSPSADKVISALGLDSVRSAAFAYQINDDGMQSTVQISVPEDARSGIFKLVAGEPKDCNPPPFVPADAIKFGRYRLDGAKSWDALRKMVGNVSAQSLGGLDFLIDSAEANAREKNPDFDIKKDLFANLGDDFISWDKAPKSDSPAEMSMPPFIMLIGSPNPEKLQTALNALLAVAGTGGAPKEREFLGKKIYSAPVPGLALALSGGAAVPGGATPAMNLNYTASGGYVAISPNPSMIEDFVRSGTTDAAKPLADLPGLAAAKQKISGPGTSYFSYQNDGEIARNYLRVVKTEAGANAIDTYFTLMMMMTGASPDSELKDWADFSLLPSYDQISKYFSFTVYSAGATPDGLVVKSYTPAPAGLKK